MSEVQLGIVELMQAFGACKFFAESPAFNITLRQSDINSYTPSSEYFELNFQNAVLQSFTLAVPDIYHLQSSAEILEELGWTYESVTMTYLNTYTNTPITSTHTNDQYQTLCGRSAEEIVRQYGAGRFAEGESWVSQRERLMMKQRKAEEARFLEEMKQREQDALLQQMKQAFVEHEEEGAEVFFFPYIFSECANK